MAEPGVKFIYLYCNDVEAMRHFYTDLLGMSEVYASKAEGAVAYDCDGLQFTLLQSEDAQEAPPGWARQPGWEGGAVATTSWSVSLTAEGFESAVARLRQADVPTLSDEPRRHPYWGLVTRDPMGNTVEVTHVPGR